MKLSLKKAIISAVVVLAGVSLFMPVASSFAAPTNLVAVTETTETTTTSTTNNATGSTTSSTTTEETDVTVARCEGGVFGWMLCPVIKLAQDFVAQMEEWIINRLDMGPLQTTGRYENLHTAWAGFRDLANVFFIGIFFVIIFAQTLNIKMDSYSIKMMLPRLIVAAIAIQFSYFIMQIGIDISNIIGNGIASLFGSVIQAGSNGGETWTTGEAFKALTVVGAGGALAVGTAILSGMIVPFLLLILAAALSILGVVITVWLRVLILQFLVLLAPLAIVAWVMPNTEKWFQAWKTNVIKLLLMYPIIVFMISAGALATNVAAISAEDGSFAKLLTACIPIIIFLMIPTAIKASGSLMNMTGNFVMGRMNNYSKAVRSSSLMSNSMADLKKTAGMMMADNAKNAEGIKTFGQKSKAAVRRNVGRTLTGNTFSYGRSGSLKRAKTIEHARHEIEQEWDIFFRDNAFTNPELLKLAEALGYHDSRPITTENGYGKKFTFKSNHHMAEAALSRMVQNSGYVEFSTLMDGEKTNNGTQRSGTGLYDHTTNQWRSKGIQESVQRALGPNAGAALKKITHAVHLQGDKAYGELSGNSIAELGAGSGITAAQQAVKWNRVNALNAMIQVINSNQLAGSIQNDVAKSMVRELTEADKQGGFEGVTIQAQGQTFTSVTDFLNKYVATSGQVTAVQGDIKREGYNPIIEKILKEQQELEAEIKRARDEYKARGGPADDHH